MASLGLRGPKLQSTEAVLDNSVAVASPWPRAWSATELAVIALIAAVACLIHLVIAARYGYFRDELYYAACGRHLAWGYVDQAPLIAVIAWFTRRLLGDSLYSLRFFPALSAGAKILLTAWMVRELNGKRFAQLLAATAVFFCPIYLTMDSFLSMNSFEPLFWGGCAAIAMRIANGGPRRMWLAFGLVAGVGILNKQSTLLFCLAFLLALAVCGREHLRHRWSWLGGLVALAIFLPNLLWEMRNRFATIEILRNVARVKNAPVGWIGYIAQQALLVHPVATPICIAGLWFFFAAEPARRFRFLGWTYAFLLGEMLLLKGRIYYLAPIYLMLFAAGAVWIESVAAERRWDWAKQVILAPLVVGGIIAAPLAMPLLPVNAAAAYSNFWDVGKVRVEREDSGQLPQFFADMFGWPQQASAVAAVYRTLSPDDRARCAILTQNYGQAGAIDYFGPAYGLPRAISGHNNYFLWGPRGYSGDVVIAVGMPLQQLRSLFGSVEQARTIVAPYAMPSENNLPVYVCRHPRMPLSQAWPKLKFFG